MNGTYFVNVDKIAVKSAPISASSTGNNTVIAAVTDKKIRVLAYTIICTTAVIGKFQSGAGGSDLTGPMPFGANGGVSPPFAPPGHFHFETAVGQLLNLNLGSAVAVGGHITYIEV